MAGSYTEFLEEALEDLRAEREWGEPWPEFQPIIGIDVWDEWGAQLECEEELEFEGGDFLADDETVYMDEDPIGEWDIYEDDITWVYEWINPSN